MASGRIFFILAHGCIVQYTFILAVHILGKAYNVVGCQCHYPSLCDRTGMHPSHRASLHAPENTRPLWFSSCLIKTDLLMPSGWVSRWIFMGDLVKSVHVVILAVCSPVTGLLQSTKALLPEQSCYCDSFQLVKYRWGQSWKLSDLCVSRDGLFWGNATLQCQRVIADPGILSFPRREKCPGGSPAKPPPPPLSLPSEVSRAVPVYLTW